MPLGRAAARLQQRHDRFDGAGHQQQPAEPRPLHDVDDHFRIEAVDHIDRRAGHERAEHLVGRAHVEHRRPGKKAVLLGRTYVHAQKRHARDLGAVADQRALRQAGGAAGVENDEPVFRIDIGTLGKRSAWFAPALRNHPR